MTDTLVDARRERAMTALDRANLVRYAGAARKREIRAAGFREGKRIVAQLLLDPPDDVQHMTPSGLIRAIPSFGHRKTVKLFRDAGIPLTDRQIGPGCANDRRPLTTRQRRELARMLLGGGA